MSMAVATPAEGSRQGPLDVQGHPPLGHTEPGQPGEPGRPDGPPLSLDEPTRETDEAEILAVPRGLLWRSLVGSVVHPPVGNRRFWYAQALVVVVVVSQVVAHLVQGAHPAVPSYALLVLLFVPTVYAATGFGLVGALTTGVEAAAGVLPTALLAARSPAHLWAALTTIAVANGCAMLLAIRFELTRLHRERLVQHERDRIAAYLAGHPLSWQHLLGMLPEGIAFVDESGTIRFANNQLAALSGYKRCDLVGTSFERLLPTGSTTGTADGRVALARKDGSEVAADVLVVAVDVEGERWHLAVIRDDEARRAAEDARAEAERRERERVAAAAKAVARSEELFRRTFDSNMAGVIVVDLGDRAIEANPAFCELIGYQPDEIIGQPSSLFTSPDDVATSLDLHARLLAGEITQATYTKRYRHKDGHILWVDIQKAPAYDETGAIAYFVASVRDVTSQHVLTAQLGHQARHDPLTGLANRRLFEERLHAALERSTAADAPLAVMLIDLDDFKQVNDTLGHHVGDELLIAVSRRLHHATRQGDTLSRLGGDEFLYLAEGMATPSEARAVADRLLAALDRPVTVAGQQLDQRASLGIAFFRVAELPATTLAERSDALLRSADIALYEAKQAGKGRPVVFTATMQQQVTNHFELDQALGHALERGEMSIHYQPIVRLDTADVVGFEALMRWYRPGQGYVPPATFVGLAEHSDRILELGRFALRHAIAEAARWPSDLAGAPLKVAVNVSPRQVFAPRFTAEVAGFLAEAALPPDRLVLEVTEGALLRDVTRATRVIGDLRRQGVHVALDDFGTGYSSLSRLAQLRPAILKIDRSFVSPDRPDASSAVMVETMLALGRRLGITVIAEGVETADQRDHLLALGCHLGQGFLFSPPVPSGELPRILGVEQVAR